MVPTEGEGGVFNASIARVRLSDRPGMAGLVTAPGTVNG